MWLWSSVPEKGVAPKFHEPWTGPYKVEKRISDVTYEISDAVKKTKKVVHFDRLKKATDGVRQSSPITGQITSSESDSDEIDLTYTIRANAKNLFKKFKYKPKESISTENDATNDNINIITKPPTPNLPTPNLSSEVEAKPAPRVSSRSTKNVPHLRFNHSINVLVLVTVLLCTWERIGTRRNRYFYIRCSC